MNTPIPAPSFVTIRGVRSPITTLVPVIIREVKTLITLPPDEETRDMLGLTTLEDLVLRMGQVADYARVVARLQVRLPSWEESMQSVQFTAIKADGTVGGFSMDRDGNVTTVWVYVRF